LGEHILKKDKQYRNTRFSADVLREALQAFRDRASRGNGKLTDYRYRVDHDDSTWHYDSLEEFLAALRIANRSAYLTNYGGKFDFDVSLDSRKSSVSVRAPTREDIEAVFEVFEKHAAQCELPPEPEPARPAPTVFIGHGRSGAWRDLKDHLHEKHGYRVEAYETGARAGHTIRDVLEDMIEKSSFAVLVMTGEDEQLDGQIRARQNVIHEAGLFQGRLGFARAILLLEEGVEEFSNVQGVQYIRFSRDNVKETFGEVLATLRREFQQ
jgi:predicted nucleotide-binding protein